MNERMNGEVSLQKAVVLKVGLLAQKHPRPPGMLC